MNQDWRAIFDFVNRYKWLFVIVVGVSVLSSILISATLPNRYTATLIASPVSDDDSQVLNRISGQLGGIAGLVGLSPSGSMGTAESLAVLTSRAFVGSFIRDRKLQSDIANSFGLEDATANDLYDVFVEKVLRTNLDTSTGLLSVSVTWTEPETAAVWANDLISRLNDEMRNQVLRESTESVKYLYEELESSAIREVQLSIFSLIENQINRATIAKVRPEYAMKVIDPALAPDVDDPTSPRPVMLIVLGGLVGFLVAAGIGIARELVLVGGPTKSGV